MNISPSIFQFSNATVPSKGMRTSSTTDASVSPMQELTAQSLPERSTPAVFRYKSEAAETHCIKVCFRTQEHLGSIIRNQMFVNTLLKIFIWGIF